MERSYCIEGYWIRVVLRDGLIQIFNDENLQGLLEQDLIARTAALVASVKADYAEKMKKPLAVSEDSLVVEIWAHVYAERFTVALKQAIDLPLVEEMADFVIHRSEVIDCGERSKDSNRFVWDLLASFKAFLAPFLPEKRPSEP